MGIECPAMPDTSAHEQRLPLGEHLEDLRHRIILALAGVCVAGGLTLWFGRQIVAWLCVPLAQAQRSAHVPAGAYTLSPIAGFAVYLKVSVVAAIIVASPWALYQLWRFFESGLYPRERRAVLLVAPFSAAMTVLGVLFMYYVMLPVCLWFLISFATSFPVADLDQPSTVLHRDVGNAGSHSHTDTHTDATVVIPMVHQRPSAPVDGQIWYDLSHSELNFHLDGQTRTVPLRSPTLISPLIEIGQYIHFVTVMALGIVVAFQLPVVMLLSAWWRLVDPWRIARYRKHCVLVCFATGMLLTPSDVLSMMLLAVPLWGLFEFGLLLMRATYRTDDSTAG